MKRFASLALTLFIFLSLAVPAGAATPVFTDIKDAETLRAANLLSSLGIVNGTGNGKFSPNEYFNRSHLAAIAAKLSGITDDTLYKNTVRFPDVRASHWAHGWIMAAVELKLVTGGTDGKYHPDEKLKYSYLITVLMRLLGYTEEDVGPMWPQNYINKAESLGISKGMSLKADTVITRAQAIRLIYNFLFIEVKGTGKAFIESKLGVTYSADDVLQFVVQNGVTYLADKKGTLYTEVSAVSTSEAGYSGKYLVDKDGAVLGFTADAEVTYQRYTVSSAISGGLNTQSGSFLPVTSATPVYTFGGKSATFVNVWTQFWPGETVLAAYSKNGKLLYFYRESPEVRSGESCVETVLQFATQNNQNYAVDSKGEYYLIKGSISSALAGRTGILILDYTGLASAFKQSATLTYKEETVKQAKASGIETKSGSTVIVPGATKVYGGSSDKYSTAYTTIRDNETVLLAYNAAGTLQYVYRNVASEYADANTIVLASAPGSGTIVSLFGSAAANAAIYKNGALTDYKTLERWDVLTYFPKSNVVYISNTRFTAIYNTDNDNIANPQTVTIAGEDFNVLPAASAKLAASALGTSMVFLFDYNGSVADVRANSEVTTFIPVLIEAGSVRINNSLVISGSIDNGFNLDGQIGRLIGVNDQSLSVSVTSPTPATADVNLTSMTMGQTPIAPWCAVYERVGENGVAKQIKLSDIPVSLIPKNKVAHAGVGACGYITTLMLDDVTGDRYYYGYLASGQGSISDPPFTSTFTKYFLENGMDGANGLQLQSGGRNMPVDGTLVAISAARMTGKGNYSIGNMFTPTNTATVTRFDFTQDYVTIGSRNVPIATDVVYVPSLKTTLSLDNARAYCQSFTVYLDPNGYKVRFIIGK